MKNITDKKTLSVYIPAVQIQAVDDFVNRTCRSRSDIVSLALAVFFSPENKNVRDMCLTFSPYMGALDAQQGSDSQ